MSMHSISGSSITGKYERLLVVMLKPARRNSSMVALSRLPLGIPSFRIMCLLSAEWLDRTRTPWREGIITRRPPATRPRTAAQPERIGTGRTSVPILQAV